MQNSCKFGVQSARRFGGFPLVCIPCGATFQRKCRVLESELRRRLYLFRHASSVRTGRRGFSGSKTLKTGAHRPICRHQGLSMDQGSRSSRAIEAKSSSFLRHKVSGTPTAAVYTPGRFKGGEFEAVTGWWASGESPSVDGSIRASVNATRNCGASMPNREGHLCHLEVDL